MRTFSPTVFAVVCFFLLYSSLYAQRAVDSIKIGVITSLEPFVAPWSESANLGLQKAADEINLAGGINGRSLKLIYEDDRFLAKNALSAYHKLRIVDQVDFIVGPQFDQTMAAVRHLANKDKQLLVQTIGTNPINEVEYGYIIHSFPSDKFAGKALARRIMRDNCKKVAFIIPEESYSQNLAKIVKNSLEGVEYQWSNYKVELKDYKPLLLKARAYQPDALVFFYMPDMASHIYRTMRQLGIRLPIYTSESIHANEQFMEDAGSIAAPTFYFVLNFDESDSRITHFLKSLPKTPTLPAYSIVAYDTLKWLAQLIAQVGTNNEAVKKALYKMKYQGLFTTYEFDKVGDHQKADLAAWRVTKDGYVRDDR